MSTFILTLKLDTEKYQEDILNKRLEIGRNIYNACLGELYKRYNYLMESKEYKKTVKMVKGKERNKKFNSLNKKFNLTEYSLHTYVRQMQHYYSKNIDSHTAQKVATRCFNSFKKLIIHQAKTVHFKKRGDFHSIESKSNKSGIRYKENMILWNKLEIPVFLKKKDDYAKEALTNKVKYCRIIRKMIRGRYNYYVQLVIDGVPPFKSDKKSGEAKHKKSIGKVGIDIGTQTIAVVSDEEVMLTELAPDIQNIEKERRILLRKLDRQRRSNNPNNFNPDGTVKRGIKLSWFKSNKYLSTQYKLKEIQRKQAVKRKQSHEILANYILSLGDHILFENMNFKGLQKKSKETTISEKSGRINRKKRFGKSLANKAPSMLLDIIERKLSYTDKKLNRINTTKVKASQYNHVTDDYKKKPLSMRWNYINGSKVQRDLCSAFIIQNVKGIDLDEIDSETMAEKYDRFKEMHDEEINRIKNTTKLLSSFGV